MSKFNRGDKIQRKADDIKATVHGISRGPSPFSDKYFLSVHEGGPQPRSKTWDVEVVDTYWGFEKANPGNILLGNIISDGIIRSGEASIVTDKPKTLSYDVYSDITDDLQDSITQIRSVVSTVRSSDKVKVTIHTDIPATSSDTKFLRILKLIAPNRSIIRRVVV